MEHTTTHPTATTEIVVTDEIRTASDNTDDVIAVAIISDGTVEVVDQSRLELIRSEESIYWGYVAVAYGYVDDDGEWSETDRHVRRYWDTIDAHGRVDHHATRIGA